MAIKLIEVSCSQCGEPMTLPEHVAELPATARLCGECVEKLLLLFVQVVAEQMGMFEEETGEKFPLPI